LINLIPPHWIAYDGISQSELTIKTIYGSELFIFGFDKPQRIEGLTRVDGGVLDELSDIKPGTVDLSIMPTMVWSPDSWLWFIGVPKRFGIGAAEYRDRCEKAEIGELPDSEVFHWPSGEIIPTEALEHARNVMDERDFDEQFNGLWLNASGGVFHAWDKEFNVRPCAYNPSRPIVVGMDYNVDPMAWIMCHIKGDTLEVFDEVWLRDTNTPAALQVMTGRYGGHQGGWQIYGDASGRSRHTSAYKSDLLLIADDPQLRAMGRTMHFDKSNPPVADRFASTNARICNGAGQRNVFVDSTCTHLIRDLAIRTYKPGTRDVDDSGDVGHITDALGYICHKRWPLQLHVLNKQKITIIQGVQYANTIRKNKDTDKRECPIEGEGI